MHRHLQPKAGVREGVHAAWLSTLDSFESVVQLRTALNDMNTGKSGRSLALEHLLHLSDADLEPWLLVTRMIFAGEMVDALTLGTVSPLAKDAFGERWRPVTLLEPIYNATMLAWSRRALRVLHEYRLLDSSQYGFRIDGNCQELLHVVNQLYEEALAGRPLRMAYLDSTAAFDSIRTSTWTRCSRASTVQTE